MLRDAKILAGRIGLLEPARGVRDALRAWRHRLGEDRDSLPSGGLPIPPARLILKVSGTPDARWFLTSGRLAAESIRAILSRHGVDIDDVPSMLDFGCGCGRVLRHWQGFSGEIHGTDCEPARIAWCTRHLAFARFALNGLEPPLPHDSGRFALVYALSVFTHFPRELQEPWMQELRRVLAPGGHLLISVHGAAYVEELTEEERAAFAAGRLVLRGGPPGSNACGAYHPEPYIRQVLARGFRLLEVAPAGAAGNPRQDLVLLQKAASSPSA